MEEEPSEKFNDLSKVPVIVQKDGLKPSSSSGGDNDDDSEIERMDIEGHEDEAQITVSPKEMDGEMNGNGFEIEKARLDDMRNEDKMGMDVDDHSSQQMVVSKVLLMNGNGGKVKPLQDHSPPLPGNGRADREEPTPVPAKMCETVSDSDDWIEPSGPPSESNSSTEWGVYTQEQSAYKEKLMNDVDDEKQQPSPARDHPIKDSMSTVTLLERSKKYLMPSTIGI